MDYIQKQIGKVWESRILEYEFDILKSKIIFKLEIVNIDGRDIYTLELRDVSVCYFINDITEKRKRIFEPDHGDYLEFTSITLLKNINVHIKSQGKEWIEQYHGAANISIEIWDRQLFVEAKSIVLDNDVYFLE